MRVPAALFVVVRMSATTVADLAVQNVPAEPPRRIATEVAPQPGKGRPRPEAVRRPRERGVVAAKDANAEFAVEIHGQDKGDLGAVVVVGVVQKRPVGKGTVGEIVAVGMLLVQVAERPQGPAGLDAHPFGQAGAGKGLDVRFLELQLGGFARVDPQAEGEAPQELVVDVARHRDLAVAEGEPLRGALALVAGREAVNLELVGGVRGGHSVQDDPDRWIEGVVGRWPGGPWGARALSIRSLLPRLHARELRLERADPRLVLALEGLNLLGQIRRGGLRLRLASGRRGNEEQESRHRDDEGQNVSGDRAHFRFLQACRIVARIVM